MRNATLVLSGGGAKGGFQVGVEQVLREQAGFKWNRIFGVSVGALNGMLLAQEEYERLQRVWQTIRENEVYAKVGWPQVAWRLVVRGKTGLYDNKALRKTIEKHAGGRAFRVPFHAGRVSLTSGQYESVPHDDPGILDAVWQSATLPVIWEPVGERALVDGGLRNVTPLGHALAFNPVEVVVVMCSMEAIEPAPRPNDILEVAKRSLADITINEIMINDVREFRRINALVKQAEAVGLQLTDEDGRVLRYCPLHVIRPRESLGDTLDFSRETLRQRLEAGRQAGLEWVKANVAAPVVAAGPQ
jgi:NTE family protein